MLAVATAAGVCAIGSGCFGPAAHRGATPSTTPHIHVTPKRAITPGKTTTRFTKDASGDQLHTLVSTPAGMAKLRAWMDAHGLKSEAVEMFIRGDNFAARRKQAVADLMPK